ncbi:helical backbone metal receptor [Nocardioides sp. TRM66260-LWL]|uniref:helical backbone metal receptor n=1 Tax=Nocardioides sp. TRM66260-LWL TaxID=2874478 RepID=UPI001CC713A3|nr:helical backbone metal receptor [Nocardioides sp. TRM66260-LWL]MBZ5734747.1 helical backbone metal receptor [Nocardioides sp. TRM66260-LWL]
MRVVSLVPSITEALATLPEVALVGATDWCTHPADLDARGVARVRGTKNPDVAAIVALGPDLVVANKEENRELDVRRLREQGVRVEVTDIATVPDAVAAYRHLLGLLDAHEPAWLAEAERLWCGPLPPVTTRVAVPIWRDPWMVVGGDTFTSDLCRRLGWENVFADADRYPRVEIAEIEKRRPDVVLLPDEPYVFTADDGPEAFGVPTALVSGRLLTWYGPSLVDAASMAELVRENWTLSGETSPDNVQFPRISGETGPRT